MTLKKMRIFSVRIKKEGEITLGHVGSNFTVIIKITQFSIHFYTFSESTRRIFFKLIYLDTKFCFTLHLKLTNIK